MRGENNVFCSWIYIINYPVFMIYTVFEQRKYFTILCLFCSAYIKSEMLPSAAPAYGVYISWSDIPTLPIWCIFNHLKWCLFVPLVYACFVPLKLIINSQVPIFLLLMFRNRYVISAILYLYGDIQLIVIHI